MKFINFDSATTQFNLKHVSTFLASNDEIEIKTSAKYITEAVSVRKQKIEHNELLIMCLIDKLLHGHMVRFIP